MTDKISIIHFTCTGLCSSRHISSNKNQLWVHKLPKIPLNITINQLTINVVHRDAALFYSALVYVGPGRFVRYVSTLELKIHFVILIINIHELSSQSMVISTLLSVENKNIFICDKSEFNYVNKINNNTVSRNKGIPVIMQI